MLLNQRRMNNSFVPSSNSPSPSSNTATSLAPMFKYIIKEKKESVIVIDSSDEGSDGEEFIVRSTSSSSFVSSSATHKRKRKKIIRHFQVQGNPENPISLDDSGTEDIVPPLPPVAIVGSPITTTTTPEIENDTFDNIPTYFDDDITPPTQDELDALANDIEESKKAKLESTPPPLEKENQKPRNDMDLDNDISIDHCTPFSPLSEFGAISEFTASEISSKLETTTTQSLEEAMDIDIITTVPALEEEEPMKPPTTVETYIPPGMDIFSFLQRTQLYIQSLTPAATLANQEDADLPAPRAARRAKRFQQEKPRGTPEIKERINSYVPNRVWYNSTWEDWAQLDVGDILHCPFTEEETKVLVHQVHRQNLRRSGNKREVDFWDYVSTMLPGRSAMDCKCFWADYTSGNSQMFTQTIIVAKSKEKPRNKSRHQLTAKRSRAGSMHYNSMRNIHYANMSRETTISEGSGDAIALTVFKDTVNGIKIAIGSLCDENTQYNMPGNLRLWNSDNEKCQVLEGHITRSTVENSPDIWRTVTDVKMSKDESLIYSASHDGSANIWRASSGKLVSTLQYHSQPINQLAVNHSTTENVLATCSNDGTATIWLVSKNGKTGSGNICELEGAEYNDPRIDCIEFGHGASDTNLFLGVSNLENGIVHPGFIDIYDVPNTQRKGKFNSMGGCISAMAVSTSGRFVLSGNYNRLDNRAGDGILHLHDIREMNVVTKFKSGHTDVNVVAMSLCERFVASGNADRERGEVAIFDVRFPGRDMFRLRHDQTLINQSLIAPDSSIGIGGLYWTSDSRTILTGGGDSTVKIWSLEGGQVEAKPLKSYQTANCVTSLTVHEDTMTIVAGVAGAQGIVHVWQP